MTPKSTYKDLPSIMHKILSKYNLKEEVYKENIINNWESFVGDKISKQCEPIEFKGGELIVQAKNDLWKQELALRHDDLLNLVNGRNKYSLVKKIKII